VLRSAAQCLLNDDPWLRSRAGDDIRRRIGLFILHPSLAACARASQTAAAAAVDMALASAWLWASRQAWAAMR
jgi:hypothetical protein